MAGACGPSLPDDGGEPPDRVSETGGDTDSDTGEAPFRDTRAAWEGAPGPEALGWPADAVVLPDVWVWDEDGARRATLVLSGDRIHAVLPARVRAPRGVRTLPVQGRWVVPGLIDPHVHLFLAGTTDEVGSFLADHLRAWLRHGVTTVVDAGAPATAHGLSALARQGDWRGPDVRVYSPMITVPGGHPCERLHEPSRCALVERPGDGAAHATRFLDRGFDGVKAVLTDAAHSPWPTDRLPVAELRQVVATAGPDRVYVHTDTERDALDALDAGARHLAHPVFGGPLSEAGAARIRAEAVAVHSTLSAFRATVEVVEGTAGLAALEGRVPDPVLASWRRVADDPEGRLLPGFVDASRGWSRHAAASVRALGPEVVIPGSDAGYFFVPHGVGLHDELDALVGLGWRPEEALTGATAGAAAALGLADRGRIRAGLRADLVVVDGDPRQDLDRLRDPAWVVAAGRPLDRTALADPGRRLVPRATVPLGGFCVDDGHCAEGRCDGRTHTCQPACPEPGALDDGCGPDATCGRSADGAGACHAVRTCDLLDPAGSCGPDVYGENCIPLDGDTTACVPSGPAGLWEACGFTDARVEGCRQGLVCTWHPPDPALGWTGFAACRTPCEAGTCGADGACFDVPLSGERWYGVCWP